MGRCFDPLKHFDTDFLIKESDDFRKDLKIWWGKRNDCLHAIVKSNRGDPTIEVVEVLEIAEETATRGRTLVRQVVNWATSQNRKIIRQNKDQ